MQNCAQSVVNQLCFALSDRRWRRQEKPWTEWRRWPRWRRWRRRRVQPLRFVLMRTIFHFLYHFLSFYCRLPCRPPFHTLLTLLLLLPAHNFYLLASCSGTLCSLGTAQVRQLWAMMTCCFVGSWQRDTQHATRCGKGCGKWLLSCGIIRRLHYWCAASLGAYCGLCLLGWSFIDSFFLLWS